MPDPTSTTASASASAAAFADIDLPSLKPLFRPRSIAVLGASSSPTKVGGRPVAALIRNRYEGAVYPVNPRSDTIQGLPAFASVKDIPGAVDLAICTVPPAAVMGVLAECAEKEVGALVVFTSGFAEVGEGAAQEAMAGLAREAGIRLMGPNCMGMANFGSRAIASFHPAFAEEVVPGQVGLVSQSGAFGGLAYMLARERGHSLSYMFTTGNEADVDIGDCTAFLADDPDTKAILLYMEGCRNGPKFLAALERARESETPVIAIKLGRTEAGAAAAASHTAALGGRGRGLRLAIPPVRGLPGGEHRGVLRRRAKLGHRDAAGERPGGDGHRLGRGRGADGGRRERARALGPGDAGGNAAADARARAVRGGPEPH